MGIKLIMEHYEIGRRCLRR